MKLGLRELMFGVLLLAILAGAWWFVFKPRNERIADDMQLIEAKRAKLQALNRATVSMGTLKTEITDLNKAISFFQSKLPAMKDMDQVLQEVWKLAEANNLLAKSVRTVQRSSNTQIADVDGPYAEQPVFVELEGDFKGLYSFMLALENKPRITRLHQVKLDKLPKGEEGQMRASIAMSIFFERIVPKE